MKEIDRLTKDEFYRLYDMADRLTKMAFGKDAKQYYKLNPLGIEYDTVSLRKSRQLLKDTKKAIKYIVALGLARKTSMVAREAIEKYIPDRRTLPTKLAQDKVECQAICKWVQEHIRYTRDPIYREFVREAMSTLFFAGADCDDMTPVVCILLGLFGHHFQIVLAGPKSGYTHVFVFALLKDGTTESYIQFPIDPTNKHEDAGWLPKFTKYHIMLDSRYDLAR